MKECKNNYHLQKNGPRLDDRAYFTGKNSHNGQRSHVQHNSSSCSQLLLVHLTTTANYISWPAACFNDHWKDSNNTRCLDYHL